MIKKTITYTNPFNEETVVEEHWFHLSKADLVRMQMETVNEPDAIDPETGRRLEGFQARLQRIINAQNGREIIAVLESILERSYGKRDGDRFLKSDEIWKQFRSSEAYSELFFEIATDAEKSGEFMNALVPAQLLAEAQAAADVATPDLPTSPTAKETIVAPASRSLSAEEAREMDPRELQTGLQDGRYTLS